jgi:hypothetical protein
MITTKNTKSTCAEAPVAKNTKYTKKCEKNLFFVTFVKNLCDLCG